MPTDEPVSQPNPFESHSNPSIPQPVPTDPGLYQATGKAIGPTPQKLSTGGIAAWVIVVLMATSLTTMVAVQQFFMVNEIGGDASASDLMQMQIQAKAIVGQKRMSELLPTSAPEEIPIPAELDGGCYEQRLCLAIVKNEIEGPEAAITYLDELDEKVREHNFERTEDQRQLESTLRGLLENYRRSEFDTSAVPEQERELMKERLGFCGQLALLPDGTDRESARESLLSETLVLIFAVGAGGLLGLLAMLAGVIAAILFLVFFFRGSLSSGLAATSTNTNLYIQTFAIWLGLFLAGSLIPEMLVADQTIQLLLQPVVFFGSLACLAWPVLRGVGWDQVRRDIGWTSPQPMTDLLWSPATYVASLPMLIPGFVFVLLASGLLSLFQTSHEFAPQTSPGHPIQEIIASGNLLAVAVVLITACIGAPVVEETMFRGVLYRHLRDWSAKWTLIISVAFSAVLNGFVFAALHPQGLIAIPVLMTLAICFSLTREWRGNLITPMAMHAMHNFLITCFSLLLL